MSSNQTPKWIVYYGIFLGLFGLIAGSVGVFNPVSFFNDFPGFTQWQEITYITTNSGVRSFAAGVAMLVAIKLGSPGGIAAVFCMRFLTELGDLVNTIMTGHGTMGLPLMVMSLIWVLLFLLPEAKAARWGFKATCAASQVS